MAERRIGITGIGLVTSHGIPWTNEELLRWGRRSHNAIEPVMSGNIVGAISKISKIDFLKLVPEYKFGLPNRVSQIAILGAVAAIKDAGIFPREFIDRLGVVLNSDFGSANTAEDFLFDLYRKGPAKVSPTKFTKTVSNVTLGEICRHYEIYGPSALVYGEPSACYAFDLIKAGKADIILCGGYDELNDKIISYYHLNRSQICISESVIGSQEEKQSNCLKPALGEGAGFLVLETFESAYGRNAEIYAELVGFSQFHSNTFDLNFDALTALDYKNVITKLREAYSYDERMIDLVFSASGPDHQQRNLELAAINELFIDGIEIKSASDTVGETFGASSMINLILAAKILYDRCNEPDTLKSSAICNGRQIGGNLFSFLLRNPKQNGK